MSKLFFQEMTHPMNDNNVSAPLSDGRNDLLHSTLAFMKISFELENTLEELLEKYNLSAARFMLLSIIKDSPQGITPSKLAQKSGVTQATISGLLNSLHKAQLIERQTSPLDGRSYTILLTEAGAQVLKEASDLWLPKISTLWAQLPLEESRKITTLLGGPSSTHT